jgi:hypothetical protein
MTTTMNDRTERCSLQHGHSSQMVVMIDMADFVWSFHMPLAYMKEVFSLLTKHYRLRLGCLFIVNAGRGFALAWSAISALLPASTLSKTRVLGSLDTDTLQLIEKEVGLQHVDAKFGGQNEVNYTEWAAHTDEYFAAGYWAQQSAAANADAAAAVADNETSVQ